ncbi:MAG: carbonic anhydrase [Bacteroidetes bacterium]|nr:MAG: carbonic anhydrase [Bacteroidota bacterium]
MYTAIIERYLENNRKWAADKQAVQPQYFEQLSMGQEPEALLIGCSDSRVSPSVVLGAELGEVFVHRNIANLIPHTDLNFLAVLQYAMEVLKVKHLIIFGHYGCGGVKAAMSDTCFGLIDNWLANIRDVMEKYKDELNAIRDEKARQDKLVELNVIEQAKNLMQTSVYRKAVERGDAPRIHTWVFDFHSGLIVDLAKETVYEGRAEGARSEGQRMGEKG